MARTVDTQGFEGLAPGRLGPLVLEAEGNADGLMLPRAFNLGGADYSRSGSDLVIIDPDGDEAIIQGYFLSDPPPPLLTETGATFDGTLISRLAGPRAPGQTAQAGPAAETQPIGRIDAVEGTVTITRADGTQVTAGIGDPVFQGDVIETSADGVIGIVFVDDTTFSLGAEGRMVLDELVYDPETQSGTSTFSLVQGVFSFVSGKISKTGVDAMEIRTPVATIGIRGTAGSIDLPAGEQLTVVLTQEADGSIGEITVFNSAGVQVLNSPFDTTQVTGFNAPPSSTFTMSVGEFNQRFAQSINALPQNNQFNQNQQDNEQNQNDEAGPPAPGEEQNAEDNPEGGEDGEAPLEEGELPPEEGELLDEEAGPPLDGEELPDEGEAGAPGDGEETAGEELAGPPAPGEGEVAGPGIPSGGPQGDQSSFGPDVAGSEDDPFDAGDVFEVSNSGVTGPTGTTGGFGGINLGGGFGAGGDGFGNSGSQPGNDDDNDDIIIPVTTPGSPGSVNSIVGTSGPDLLNGTAGSDVITGGDGDDTVFAGAGNDTIIGGTGNGYDTYDGGDGEDWLYYPSASSGITVDLGNGSASGAEIDTDTLYNVEHVLGGSGDDTLWGSSADNSLLGGAGNDTLDGGSGNDTLIGGAGFDIAYYSSVSGPITVDLASGTATGAVGNDTLSGIEAVLGGSYNDTLSGDANANSLNGGSGDDVLDGRAGNDTLTGGGGNDTIYASSGHDVVYGGSGTQDRIDFSNATSGVTVNLGDTSAQNPGGGIDEITLAGGDIEGLVGSDFDDSLAGNTQGSGNDNYVDGGAGNDTISGGNGTNTLLGGAGDDIISGGSVSDTLDGGSGNDSLFGGNGDDSYIYSGGNDTITETGGNDTLSLGASDTVSDAYTDGTDIWLVLSSGNTIRLKEFYFNGGSLETLSYTTLSKIYTIVTGETGSGGNDLIAGSATGETLTGNGGDDLVFAHDGNDTVIAGSGNDTYWGGNGNDTVDYSYVSSGVTANLATGVITGLGSDMVSGIENISGSQGNDILTGDSGDNLLDGNGGSDTLVGGGGNDTLNGGGGVDLADYSAATAGVTVDLTSGQATGGAGNDSLLNIENVLGSDFDDTLTGNSSNHLLGGAGDDLMTANGSGSDTFEGGAGNDTLQTGFSSDTLIGGAGDDLLQGGSSNDSYLYNLGDGNDTIDDSSGSDDTLILDATTSFDSAARVGDNLVLTVNGGATIVIKDHYNGQPLESLDVGALSTVYNILTGLTGSPSNELIVSGTSDDVMSGGSGNDYMFGGAGNDQVNGNNGNDRIYGGAGDDTVSGGSGNDTVYGDSGDDYVAGGAGNDTLFGGSGNDTVAGGSGGDIIYLGAGNDTLYYDDVSHVGDTIMDFDPANDIISFNNADFGGLLGGILGLGNFVTTSTLPVGGDGTSLTPTFIFFDNPTGNDALYYDEDGSLGGFTVTKVADFNGGLSGFDNTNIALTSGQA